ncbi:Homeodomain-containing transcription factor [Pyrenophora tritici-repentis]|uniref:Homeodomain-containing transcription factor n=1 Tax=Pyrenophora tritici-repentis TaxID=45151 RepID=A0A922SS51_9PLEO|nr:Homeodomain-containing transcription factor [Pyrenophora tritici-repentis]
MDSAWAFDQLMETDNSDGFNLDHAPSAHWPIMESDWIIDQFKEIDNFDGFDLDSADFGTSGSFNDDDNNFFETSGIPDDGSTSHTSWRPSTLTEQTAANVANPAQASESQYNGEEVHLDPPLFLLNGKEQHNGDQPVTPNYQPELSGLTASGFHSYQRETQMISMGSGDAELGVTEASDPITHLPPLESMSDVSQHRAKRRRTSKSSSRNGKKKRQTRIIISPAAQKVLEQHFYSSPYPDETEVAILADETGLPIRSVRNWFSNSRTRKTEANGKFPETDNTSMISFAFAMDMRLTNENRRSYLSTGKDQYG